MKKAITVALTAVTLISPMSVSAKDVYSVYRNNLISSARKSEDGIIAAYRKYAESGVKTEAEKEKYYEEIEEESMKGVLMMADVSEAYVNKCASEGKKTKAGKMLVNSAKKIPNRVVSKTSHSETTFSVSYEDKLQVLGKVFLARLNHKKVTGNMLKAEGPANLFGSVSLARYKKRIVKSADAAAAAYRKYGHKKEAMKFMKWAAVGMRRDFKAAEKAADDKFKKEVTDVYGYKGETGFDSETGVIIS